MPTKRTRNGQPKPKSNPKDKPPTKRTRCTPCIPNGKTNGHKDAPLSRIDTAFALLYDGNGVEAMRLAGHKGNYGALGQAACKSLKNAKVLEIIEDRARQEKVLVDGIAGRIELQQFWTRVFLGEETQEVAIGKGEDRTIHNLPPAMKDRLEASKLLGKSQALFIDRKSNEFPDGIPLKGEITMDFLKGLDMAKLKGLKELFG